FKERSSPENARYDHAAPEDLPARCGRPLLSASWRSCADGTRVYAPRRYRPVPVPDRPAWRRLATRRPRVSQRLRQYAGHVGCVIVALNFRQGADAYPSSLVDINYGIRWVKANAARFRIDPRRIALGGNSTGGHLAMLAAMRPREPRYAAILLPEGSPRVDASVRAVVMHWPIINPLSRYRSLLLEKGRFRYGIEYWQIEANAAEGNPMLMLERGERVDLPRAIWIQGRSD